MNAVYPITALYLGPFALAFYRRWGRTDARTTMAPGSESQTPADRPWWAMMAMEVSHCGSGCVLGDVISEFSIFGLALTVALTAFEIGLFGWMAVMAFVLFPAPNHLMPNTAAYWLLMQIGMIIGFATSWPANVWLVNRGIKVAM